MPIYEYLCVPCNRVFSFMAKSHAETREKNPACPQCGGPEMRRALSRFAIGGGTRKSAGEGAPGASGAGGEDGCDDPRVEREMMRLMDAAEGMDDNDPRQLGALMRRMSEISGEHLDPAMEEAVRRLESGEDPEKIEEDLGELLDDGGEGEGMGMGGGGCGDAPSYDDGLYSF